MKGLYRYIGVAGCMFFLTALSLAQSQDGSLGGTPILTGAEGAPPDWGVECTDPMNTGAYSAPYIIQFVGNELMFCSMGGGGSWNAGGTLTPPGGGTGIPICWISGNSGGSETMNNIGQFCFSYGYWAGNTIQTGSPQAIPPVGLGSAQQYSFGFRDANLALNYGAPTSPGYCYADFVEDGGTPTKFGSAWNLFYAGESNRYMTFEQDGVGSFNINLQIELVADAVRFRWTCTNTTTASHTLQMWFCSGIDMMTDQNAKYWQSSLYAQGNWGQPYFPPVSPGGSTFGYGPDASGAPSDSAVAFGYDPLPGLERLWRNEVPDTVDPEGYQGIFVYLPNQRPPTTDEALIQAKDPVNFPAYVDFDFGESDPFGMRIETKPSTSTNDTNPTNIPNKANEIVLGKSDFIIGPPATPLMSPTALIPDTGFLDIPAFIIMYDPAPVAGGATYQFLNYVRSTWGNASYSLPFGAVVDAPSVIQEGDRNFDGTSSGAFNPTGTLGGHLVSNATAASAGYPDSQLIRVWIDNVGGNVTNGYGVRGKEFNLDDVQVNLTFGAPGMTIVSPGGGTQTISSILPRTDAHVDFYVHFAQKVVGDIPYTVTINTVPINQKVITGTMEVSGRPQLTLYPGANLVAAPYVFTDSSWLSILSDFTSPATAGVGSGATTDTYVWDPNRQAYDLSLSASRGNGYWVVYNNPAKKPVFAQMEGSPSTPQGFDNSTQQLELKPGWNLIANPYDLEFSIAQVNGVAAANPDTVYTYSELVNLGYISGFVANWDPVNQVYDYTSGLTGNLEPNTGYWINNLLASDITLSYPSLFSEGSPGSSNKAPTAPLGAGIWRLNLTATEGAFADNATVGNAASPSELHTQTIYKAPQSPTQKLLIGLYGTASGRTEFLSQALASKASSYAWSGFVSDMVAGSVTLHWPNVGSVPSNLGVFLADSEGGKTIDMRQFSSYSYAQITTGVRHFRILVQPVTASNSLISSLNVSTQKVGTSSEDKFTYVLTQQATTTVDIRTPNNLALVAQVHANRADAVGTSIDLWNMKDSLGRPVPAGKYIVWLKAVTASGVEQTATVNLTVP